MAYYRSVRLIPDSSSGMKQLLLCKVYLLNSFSGPIVLGKVHLKERGTSSNAEFHSLRRALNGSEQLSGHHLLASSTTGQQVSRGKKEFETAGRLRPVPIRAIGWYVSQCFYSEGSEMFIDRPNGNRMRRSKGRNELKVPAYWFRFERRDGAGRGPASTSTSPSGLNFDRRWYS